MKKRLIQGCKFVFECVFYVFDVLAGIPQEWRENQAPTRKKTTDQERKLPKIKVHSLPQHFRINKDE